MTYDLNVYVKHTVAHVEKMMEILGFKANNGKPWLGYYGTGSHKGVHLTFEQAQQVAFWPHNRTVRYLASLQVFIDGPATHDKIAKLHKQLDKVLYYVRYSKKRQVLFIDGWAGEVPLETLNA